VSTPLTSANLSPTTNPQALSMPFLHRLYSRCAHGLLDDGRRQSPASTQRTHPLHRRRFVWSLIMSGVTTESAREIRELKRKNGELEQTVEILKAATSFFVRESDPRRR